MTHATDLVQNYRLAMRALWNEYYWADYRFRDSETANAFQGAALPIFQALVHSRMEPFGEPAETLFGNGYRVIGSKAYDYQIRGMTLIGQPGGMIGGAFRTPPLELTLLDFFDWDLRNWRDFRYYLTRIDQIEGHEELIGREVIVDVLEADVVWGPKLAVSPRLSRY